MTLIGRKVLQYEIRGLLGAGGMGEVYEARDFDLEIVLGPTTLLGEVGHHAAKTLPALEAAAGRKITVSKLGQ